MAFSLLVKQKLAFTEMMLRDDRAIFSFDYIAWELTDDHFKIICRLISEPRRVPFPYFSALH